MECRVFRYEDEVYEIPPKEMIANAILKTLFSDNVDIINTEYIISENLKEFYASKSNNKNGKFTMKRISIYEPAMCCETGVCGVGVDPELLRISTAFSNLKKYCVVVNRYNLSNAPQEFIKNVEINKLINDPIEITSVNGNLSFNNVSFSYAPDLPKVLEDVTFDIKHGEYLALVGKSGSGKLTLSSLIARFITTIVGPSRLMVSI